MIPRCLTAIVIFTLLWTGTLWHDFFGMEIMPLMSQCLIDCQSRMDHKVGRVVVRSAAKAGNEFPFDERDCTDGGDHHGVALPNLVINGGSCGELPCSCPSHVHSPSCLSKVDTGLQPATEKPPPCWLACIVPGAVRDYCHVTNVSGALDSQPHLRSRPVSLYLTKRSLLI